MNPSGKLKPFDVQRLVLLNHLPWTFVIEAILRLTVVYLVFLVAARLMGKRMASQTTRNEIAALVALAGGIGPAIQDPKQGLLPMIVVCAVVVGLQRLVSAWMAKHEGFEQITQGRMTLLVRDGEFLFDALKTVTVPKPTVMAQLRAKGIRQLGSVDRLYLELNGAFTLIRANKSRPGLSLVPVRDKALRERQIKAEGHHSCSVCGHTEFDNGEKPCPVCRETAWEPAVYG